MNKGRSRRRPNKRSRVNNSVIEFIKQPAYRGQPVAVMDLPCASYILSTTATTGVIANNFQLNVGSILNFTTRYGAAFSEYAIIGCEFKIRPLAASTGVSAFWFDDTITTAPTLNESMGRIAEKKSNTNASPQSAFSMYWKARQLTDLTFNSTSTSYTAVNFKVYTDNANYNAPVTAAPMWLIQPVVKIILRGLKST